MADDLDDEFPPPRRRIHDLPGTTGELILYQLSELKAQVAEGFQKIEGRFDKVEDRVGSLERFRERQEERDRTEAQQSGTVNARWVPIALGLATILAMVFLFLAGKGG